jgi:transcriptional regulator with XRE-family HTH domain
VLGFGPWLKKIRERAGIKQRAFARLLGLESTAAIYHLDRRAKPNMRGTTLEALLELLGYESQEEMERAWRAGEYPDSVTVRARAALATAPAPFVLPPAAQRKLDLLADEAGAESGEWVAKMLEWLDRQTPEFREFVSDAVAAQAKRRPITPRAVPSFQEPGSPGGSTGANSGTPTPIAPAKPATPPPESPAPAPRKAVPARSK